MKARTVQAALYLSLGTLPVCVTAVPARGCEVPGQQAGQTASAAGAQGSSQSGVLKDFQDQVLSQSGSQDGTPPGGGTSFPTGRLGETWHAPYVSSRPSRWPAYKSQTVEESAMGSAFYRIPQSVFGGNLQTGAFGGENWVNTSYTPSSSSGRSSGVKQYNSSYVAGGYVLYSFGGSYVMDSVAVFEGSTDQKGAGFAGGSSSYGTHGYANTAVAGHVFNLDRTGMPLKVDVRGGLLYSNAQGGSFSNSIEEVFRPSTEETAASFSAMLFRDVGLSGGATVRPYVKAGLKEQLAYSNKVEDSFGGALTTYSFSQSSTFGNAEIGFDYNFSNVTVTGAVYGETAADQSTLGGRLGAKFAF
jgi:hypothetical protein